MKRLLLLLVAAVVVLAAVVVVRTLGYDSRQMPAQPATDISLDAAAAAERLAGALRFQTTAHQCGTDAVRGEG